MGDGSSGRFSFGVEQGPLLGGRLSVLLGQTDDLWPALDEAVVRQGLLGPLLALADRVQPIGKLPRNLGLCT